LGTGGVFLRKLRASISERPTGFVWIEKGRLAGSGYPASRGQLQWLSANGIEVILSLTEDPLPGEWLRGLPLTVENMPMRDHAVPDVDRLGRAASYIREQLNGGKAVLVHCLAGEGRTGCVLAAFLISSKEVGATEAITILRRLKPEFVETQQEKAVGEFAAARSSPPER
jgi:atypical dual specificity phosphatase